MATTTNYGWTTPDDTALVKDGAAAIRTLGTSIDTTTFNNASAAIAKTIVDAKGDIIVATAADTVSRLAVGANDTVLVADSAQATGVKWATPSSGGMTLLSTTTLSGASTTISSISQSYTELRIVARGIVMSTENDSIKLMFNSDTANYVYAGAFNNNGVSSTTSGSSNIVFAQGSATSASGAGSDLVMDLLNYTSTGTKQFIFTGHSRDGSGRNRAYIAGGVYVGTSAVTSLLFESASPYTFSAGTVLIYGVK
jgi:hypothetical protein